ncbi:unnamed protein product [Arctogadus glacialis]
MEGTSIQQLKVGTPPTSVCSVLSRSGRRGGILRTTPPPAAPGAPRDLCSRGPLKALHVPPLRSPPVDPPIDHLGTDITLTGIALSHEIWKLII